MSSQRLLIRNGFVVSIDPDVGDVPGRPGARRGRQDRRRRHGPRRLGRGGDRRLRDDRDARLHRHPPPHLADAGARRPPLVHARPLLRGHARPGRRLLSSRGRPHRRLRRLARGAQRRRHDAARLVAHLEHARPLRRGDPGTARTRASAPCTRTACRPAASGGRSASSSTRPTSAASARRTSRPTTA